MKIEGNEKEVIVCLILQKCTMFIASTERWLDELLTYEEAKYVYDHITKEQKEIFSCWEEVKGLIEDDILIPQEEVAG